MCCGGGGGGSREILKRKELRRRRKEGAGGRGGGWEWRRARVEHKHDGVGETGRSQWTKIERAKQKGPFVFVVYLLFDRAYFVFESLSISIQTKCEGLFIWNENISYE